MTSLFLYFIVSGPVLLGYGWLIIAHILHFSAEFSRIKTDFVRRTGYGEFKGHDSRIRLLPPDDFLRSVKNSMISLNTLCRIAARRGGVSAFIVGSISYKYGLLIEGSSSVEFLQKKVTPMMFSDYCLAVRDCSTAQYSAKVQEITTYILEHLPSELTVNQLAELFFLNVSSLSRKFKSETGFSVTEFINFHRIKLAQYYLSQGNRSITEVAYLVGYNDSNYFCRMFKKVTSITPSQYLKNVRTEGMLI